MQLIERREIKDEEAAALIAAFPKTIREPTEEMQRRFLVGDFSFPFIIDSELTQFE